MKRCALLFVILMVALAGKAQTTTPGRAGDTSDALPFLSQVCKQYAEATAYHVESTEESQTNGEFRREWSKTFVTSIAGPGNRYRFETQGYWGRAVQISDGQTEWIYSPSVQQYIQRPASGAGPRYDPRTTPVVRENFVRAGYALKALSALDKSIRTATYAPDQTIELNGQSIPCTVVHANGEIPGHITTHFTFWIDKETKVIRKMTERLEGPLYRTDTNYVLEREVSFSTADLAVASFPEGTFTFQPPATARLVEEFGDQNSAAIQQFAGKDAPAIHLKAADGSEISLQSFQGKAVLLDFWATWCGPCVESLPALGKVYRELGGKGLVLLSIDQDAEEKKAADFWTQHKEPWPNFHGTSEVLRQFPRHGIPFLVLIDKTGHIAFAEEGFREDKLRAALATLGLSSRAAPTASIH